MLEERVYTQEELAEALGTTALKNIKGKLNRYNIEYTATKAEKSYVFNIHKINDKFKVFCILDLGFAAQTDFSKLKYFLYFFFNDDNFNIKSHNLMAKELSDTFDKVFCRQTIKSWIEKLDKQNLFVRDISEYKYFSVSNENYKEISHEEYKEAWKVYWKHLSKYSDEEYIDYSGAFGKMYEVIGGKAVKRPRININGFYTYKIQKLTEYAVESIENEINSV